MSPTELRVRTAITPIIWGTTYLVTTEFLPAGRPIHAAFFRAAIAGLALFAVGRRLPPRGWWWRSFVLGTLNIGAFFIFLFVAVYRLPGGLAATVGSISPIIVAVLSVALLGERITRPVAISGVLGVAGVALLVLRSDVRLDPLGIAAAIAGAFSMGIGLVLTKRWRAPASLVAATSWQLLAGAVVLAPVALIVDGMPSGLSAVNIGGYLWLGIFGGAIAYSIWFRGLGQLSATQVSMLSLLSPVTATLLGIAIGGERFTTAQFIGMFIVLAAILIGQHQPRPATPLPPQPDRGTKAELPVPEPV